MNRPTAPISLRRVYEEAQRKNDPLDLSQLSAGELAGLLHGRPDVLAEIEAHMSAHPELWDRAPADVMRALRRLPGVGSATAAWWVLNELQIGRRLNG